MSVIGADSFRVLVEGSPDGFFVHDATGHILDVNARSCIDLGYSRAELLRMTINDISCGATPAENAASWANATPGTAVTIQEIAVRKDRSTFPVEISLTCQIMGSRKLFLGLARDMSQREAARLAMDKLNSELEVRVEQRTRELREAYAKLQAVMDSAHDAIAFQDQLGRYLMLNRSAETLAGVPQAHAFGKDTIEIFGAKIGARLRLEEDRVLASGTLSIVEEAFRVGKDERVFLITRSPHRDGQGEAAGLVSIARDVTDLRRNETEIKRERERLILAARVGGIGIWDYDLIRDVMHCDEQWWRIMGREPNPPSRSVAEFRNFIHPDDVDRATEVEQTASRLVASGQDYGIVFRVIRPGGEIRWVRSAACLVEDKRGRPARAVGFVVDITEAWLAEEQLKQVNLSLLEEREALSQKSEMLGRQAGEDPLTGIANRRRFDQELERACRDAARTRQPLALAMIDVDFFKLYNDRHGHVQGDIALQTIARILASAAQRPYDLAARYGGEEFVLLLSGIDQPEAILEGIATQLAQAKLPHIASPICPHVTISCGCIVASDLSALGPRDLLMKSDQALYRAKESGRNRIVVART